MSEAGYTTGDTQGMQGEQKGSQAGMGGRGVEPGAGGERGVPFGGKFLEDKRGPSGFPYAEKHVAARLGLNKDEMRALRQRFLQEGSEFCRDKKERVWLSIQGLGFVVTKIMPNHEKVAQGEAGEEISSVKKVAAIEPEKIVLVRVGLKNPHMVLGCRQAELTTADGWRQLCNRTGLLRMRVRSQEGLREGMVLEATRVEGYADLYDLVPGQLRRKGKGNHESPTRTGQYESHENGGG